MIVAHSGRLLERISKCQIHIIHHIIPIQIQSQSNLCIALGDRVDGIQHTAYNEHLTYLDDVQNESIETG